MVHPEARWVAIHIRSNLTSPTPNRQDRGKGCQTIKKCNPNSPGTSLKEEKIALSLWNSQLQEFLIHPFEIQGRSDCSKFTNQRGFFSKQLQWERHKSWMVQAPDAWLNPEKREKTSAFLPAPSTFFRKSDLPQKQAWVNQESWSFPVCNLLPQPMSGSDSYSKSHSWLPTRANAFLSE